MPTPASAPDQTPATSAPAPATPSSALSATWTTQAIVALIGVIITALGLFGGTAIAWGAARQTQEELAKQQDSVERRVVEVGLRLGENEKNWVVVNQKLDTLNTAVAEKASRESVVSLKESIAEIKTMLTAARRAKKENTE